MALSIRDKQTDAAVRRLAEMKKIGLTEAVKLAVDNELRRAEDAVPLIDWIKALQDEYKSRPETGKKADKAFFDDLGDNL